MKRENWSAGKHTLICSDHFLEKYMDRSGKIVKVTPEAIPTRFKKFPHHLKKIQIERKPPAKRKLDMPPSNYQETPTKKTKLNESSIVEKSLAKKDNKITSLRKKMKLSHQNNRRLKKKIQTLNSVIDELNDKRLISPNCEEILKESFSSIPSALFKRLIESKKGEYNEELRSFALTLQFYSSKAYEFVRQTFDLALPSQSQIRRWYQKVPAEPGFTEPSFKTLKFQADQFEQNGKTLICSLMIDEMAIKQHISWDGKKTRGYVDLGNGVENDSLPEAKDALVFMLVSLNSNWKIPCAYFFVNGLTGQERANLVTECIERLTSTGIKIASLTCDGPSCHFAMLKELGASLNKENLMPYFPHPSNKNDRIYVILDICHMIKLVRNTLGELGQMFDENDNKISWKFIKNLQYLQEKEGLRLGNKLKKSHINYYQQKMKVNLAVQTISSSVADAIEYGDKTLKLPEFSQSDATVKFLRVIDHAFDILNSRNPLAKGYKAALSQKNKHLWKPFLTQTLQYISKLKDNKGNNMCMSRRKTGFLGFMICIKSTLEMFTDFVETNKYLGYMLMYKFSQDHLELFFGAIRSCGGFNNNPTVQQFIASYKRLLTRCAIKCGAGNCLAQDNTNMLPVISLSSTTQNVSISDINLVRRYDLLEPEHNVLIDHDYINIPNVSNLFQLTEFKQAAISYIAGYAANMASKKTICGICSNALGSRQHEYESTFLQHKDRGNLFKPTKSVIVICEESEKCFSRLLVVTGGKMPQATGIVDAICTAVLTNIVRKKVFAELDDHMLDTSADDNHVILLMKEVVRAYSKIRLHHTAKTTTEKNSGKIIRKKLSKLILFHHQ